MRGLVVDRVRVLFYYIVLGGTMIWDLQYGVVACIIVTTVIVVRSGGYCKSRVS